MKQRIIRRSYLPPPNYVFRSYLVVSQFSGKVLNLPKIASRLKNAEALLGGVAAAKRRHRLLTNWLCIVSIESVAIDFDTVHLHDILKTMLKQNVWCVKYLR